MNIINSLYKSLENSYTSLKGQKILVAFSGGKDSCFLLYSLVNIVGPKEIVACYVNHNIRNKLSIENDIAICRRLCSSLDVPLVIESIDVLAKAKEDKASIESSARKLRYEALKANYDKTNSNVLLTAHNQDDAIESFFVDIITGSSIFTLGGILPSSYMFGMNIYRPIINIKTEEILSLLNENNIEYVKDETNEDEKYTRNFVRKNISPHFSSYRNNILRLQKESQDINELFKSFEENIIKTVGEQFFIIKKQPFKELESLKQQFILLKYMNYYFRAEKKHFQSIMKIFSSGTSKRINLPDDFICEISYNYLSIYHKHYTSPFYIEKKAREKEVFLSNNLIHIEFSGNLLYNNLIIRNRRDGDVVGNKKLKDIFIDNKIESIIRDMAVVVESCDGIIFVEDMINNENIRITRKGKNIWNSYIK